jgi:NADH-quinone oxidoreductase subunit M
VFAFTFMVVTLSSIGLPGLNGFVGEILVLMGSFEHNKLATAFAATGVILGAVYMLWMYQRVMFGKLSNPKNADMADMTKREIAYMAPLLVLIVLMGVYPQPFLAKMAPSVDRVLEAVDIKKAKAKRAALLKRVKRAAAAKKAAARGRALQRGKSGGKRGKRGKRSKRILNLGGAK